MAESTTARGRISARCAKSQQDKIDTAAALCGATLNQFVLQAALEKAEKIIEQERVIFARADDAAMILKALENPAEPNAALSKLLANYKKKVADGLVRTSIKPARSRNR